jgi:hypothetical protein
MLERQEELVGGWKLGWFAIEWIQDLPCHRNKLTGVERASESI